MHTIHVQDLRTVEIHNTHKTHTLHTPCCYKFLGSPLQRGSSHFSHIPNSLFFRGALCRLCGGQCYTTSPCCTIPSQSCSKTSKHDANFSKFTINSRAASASNERTRVCCRFVDSTTPSFPPFSPVSVPSTKYPVFILPYFTRAKSLWYMSSPRQAVCIGFSKYLDSMHVRHCVLRVSESRC